jgi:hypothetical protein
MVRVKPPSIMTWATVVSRRRVILWGSNIGFWGWPAGLWCLVRSCGEVILVGEPVEDWSAVNLAVGEVGHGLGLSFGLGRGELPGCAVRAARC